MLVAELSKNAERPCIIVTPDVATANRLYYELKFFLNNELPCMVLPDWETLPYDKFSPHQDIISDRLKTLYNLPSLSTGVVIAPIPAVLPYTCPQEYIKQNVFEVKEGDKIEPHEFAVQLTNNGYSKVQQVFAHGEFSIRGSILDVFPMGAKMPLRIDFFDDNIDSIRVFNSETQRSIQQIKELSLLPAREFPTDESAIKTFRTAWREHFKGNPQESHIYLDVSAGTFSPGIEYYMPLFFNFEHSDLVDYFPQNTLVISLGDINTAADQLWENIQERFEQYRHDVTKPLLEPQNLYLRPQDLLARLNTFKRLVVDEKSSLTPNEHVLELPDLSMAQGVDSKPDKLLEFIKNNEYRVLIVAESAGRQQSIMDLLSTHNIDLKQASSWIDFITSDHKLCICVHDLDQGFILNEYKLAIITENCLFGPKVAQRRRRKSNDHQQLATGLEIRNIAELKIGDPIVHVDFGIGKYLGLMTLNLSGMDSEFIALEYANEDKIYLPVTNIELLSRYSGSDVEKVTLNNLKGNDWEKTKRKAAEQINDIAADLLELYAQREASVGVAFNQPDSDYHKFAMEFPFEETTDQSDAIADVVGDLTSKKPMDRVVCGDVGFGKTEVAMRAAFMAINSGYQVAILVPTTLLSQQHFQTFRDRFANTPAKIGVLSRFNTKKEQDQVIAGIEAGNVDIVIGTHKLINSEIKFKNLGLLIVDEEHRFGVKQKEKLRAIRAKVDLLTLTATPIPRTLNFAMAKIRDFSIIASPPAKRLAIKTFVHEYKKDIIQEALLRELRRGGQVYFLHNSVETIENARLTVQELVPEARVAVAHGQMRERELEKIMVDFYHRRYNVLVCTTIIETGIDIPTANTIIIERADKFGLAQLHQLRGRVGRSHHQAYAFCLTPKHSKITKDAQLRLAALEKLEDLGSGFSLATQDLEIRGAGEILGEGQSGHMQGIGYTLYMELLQQAVKDLKAGKSAAPSLSSLKISSDVDLGLPALIPNLYISDLNLRLLLYKRIACLKDDADVQELREEFIDRFGPLPTQVKSLFAVSKIKILCKINGIKSIKVRANNCKIEFSDNTSVDPEQLISLMVNNPGTYKLEGSNKLNYNLSSSATDPDARVGEIRDMLNKLLGKKDQENNSKVVA